MLKSLSEAREAVRQYCIEHGISNLSMFGSFLRNDFNSESDIDLLIEFNTGIEINLFDFLEIKHELEDIFGRPVDLVEPLSLINPFRRKKILDEKVEIYAS